MRTIIIFLLLMIGCANITTQKQVLQQVQDDAYRNAQDSILFSNPVINFCLDKDNNLLVIGGGQEKFFSVDFATKKLDTVILLQKINFLKGIASDGIYIYLYTENSLYRFDKIRQQIITLISPQDRIKVNDLTVTTEGEIFVSDGLNNQILFINSLGKIERFNKLSKDLFVPLSIFYDTQQRQLLVINQAQSRLEIYSRIGNLLSVIPIPKKFYVKIMKYQNKIFALQNNFKNIDLIEGVAVKSFIQSSRHKIINFSIIDNTLYILDANKGIYQYSLQF